MGTLHDRSFPGESSDYRAARDKLLQAERDLRTRIEEVAALRRKLPVGGEVPQDRVIDGVDQLDFLLGRREKSNREGSLIPNTL